MTQEQENKLSERKTVHEWLNAAGIPREESGKPICLLRRLRITLDQLFLYRVPEISPEEIRNFLYTEGFRPLRIEHLKTLVNTFLLQRALLERYRRLISGPEYAKESRDTLIALALEAEKELLPPGHGAANEGTEQP